MDKERNSLHQLGQPVAPFILFPVFKSEGEPGIAPRVPLSVPGLRFRVKCRGAPKNARNRENPTNDLIRHASCRGSHFLC